MLPLASRLGLAYGLVMFAQSGVYHSAIEQDLGGIRNGIESFECSFKLVIVIMAQR